MPDPSSSRRTVTYVLPVYDEAAGIDAFHHALLEATRQRPDLDFEFVYVDDGSRDDSLSHLLGLRERDPRVTVAGLARNFGHQIAITAGLFLLAFQQMFLGDTPERWRGLPDVKGREKFALGVLLVFVVALGVYPRLALDLISAGSWLSGAPP